MSNPIDHALAIWQINPQAEYRLDQSVPPNVILEWRGPGLEPTEAALYAAWLKCTTLESDKEVIQADGLDVATIMVESGEAEASIDVLVRDDFVVVPLTDGVGELEIAAGTPTLEPHITIRLSDQVAYGSAQITVKAV